MDEMIVPYKGEYCLMRQHMPRKIMRWNMKVWYLIDTHLKYIYHFQIYTLFVAKRVLVGGKHRDPKIGHEVILQPKLAMDELHGLASMVFTNNFFTSVKLVVALRTLRTFDVAVVYSD